MATLSAEGTLTIGEAVTPEVSLQLTVLTPAATGEGKGRLVHPSLGTFDYLTPPDEWLSLVGDAIVPPVWASQMTLGGAASTLWPGYLRDVVPEERWLAEGGLSMELDQLQMLLAMWQAPPDPPDEYVEWWPSYATDRGWKCIILDVSVGGQGVAANHLMLRSEEVPYPVTMRLRLVEEILS